MARLLFTPRKDPVPIVQEVVWAPGPVWTGVENLAPTGIRSPDCPARSQLLYWLRNPAHEQISENSENDNSPVFILVPLTEILKICFKTVLTVSLVVVKTM